MPKTVKAIIKRPKSKFKKAVDKEIKTVIRKLHIPHKQRFYAPYNLIQQAASTTLSSAVISILTEAMHANNICTNGVTNFDHLRLLDLTFNYCIRNQSQNVEYARLIIGIDKENTSNNDNLSLYNAASTSYEDSLLYHPYYLNPTANVTMPIYPVKPSRFRILHDRMYCMGSTVSPATANATGWESIVNHQKRSVKLNTPVSFLDQYSLTPPVTQTGTLLPLNKDVFVAFYATSANVTMDFTSMITLCND